MSPGRRREQRQPHPCSALHDGLQSSYGRFRSVMGKLTWDTATDVRPVHRIVRDRRARNGRERLRGWRARPRGELGRPQRFLPTRGTEAPRSPGFRPRNPNSGTGRKIVAAGFGKREKRGGHDGADRVATDVLSPGVAAAVSKEAGHGVYGAEFKPVTEHVTGRVPPTGAITLSSLSIAASAWVSPTDCSPSCNAYVSRSKTFRQQISVLPLVFTSSGSIVSSPALAAPHDANFGIQGPLASL